MLYKQNSVSSL